MPPKQTNARASAPQMPNTSMECLSLIAKKAFKVGMPEREPIWKMIHLYQTDQPSSDGKSFFLTMDLGIHRHWLTDEDAVAWKYCVEHSTPHQSERSPDA